ncbi:SH3 domain-containing protein [Oscillatoria sp. FACHB-1407]|uniref:SH3 domain-containing protein n=1 Tax=Oscillatoria sp. FACHB-1407 TaxID=2692847 RepID=UPI001683F97C|nr:SH3 domain-containing protein [Oscillatoria sp. FACHB-1407]MBD2462106.1 SH3 domain-containing protein [Oscillatoria sp. FACHB-1407]
METLAFIYVAVACEDPISHYQLRSLEELGIKPASAVGLGVAGVAALSVFMATPEAQAIVQRGDTCPAVRDVQTALQSRGYEVGGVDGIFGGKTEFAVGSFQRRNGLNPTLKVDPATAQALRLSGAVYAPNTRCSSVASVGNTTNRPTPANPNRVSESGSNPSFVTVATNGSPLNIRSAPNSDASVIGTLPNTTRVRTNGRRSNGWVGLEQGGWVAANWVRASGGGGSGDRSIGSTTPSPTSAGQVRVTTNGNVLNVRSGPGTDFNVIDELANGAIVSVSGRTSDGWLELSNGGWIASSWVNRSPGQANFGAGGGSGTNTVTVATNGNPLNARFGPSPRFDVAMIYPDGTLLRTTGRIQNGWIQLANGLWVSSEWVN